MKKIFITDFDKHRFEPREIFALTRPFLNLETGNWKVDYEHPVLKSFADSRIEVTKYSKDADLILVSEPLDHNSARDKYEKISNINKICRERNILAYVFVSGDYGKTHPRFSNIIYYRMGGFKSQLDENNKAFFFLLSDQLKKLLGRDDIVVRQKEERPTVGFCGHASDSFPKYCYEKLQLAKINLKRILGQDFNLEPLFSSAYERKKILDRICGCGEIKTNFIFRKKYRAGSVTEEERRKTTIEYYENIIGSDYIVCLRGSGNFSVRLFETLMMGRIPVFINTDCLLPLEDEIEWKKHVVWVEWNDRANISAIIQDFHRCISSEEFIRRQKRNRELWKSRLTVGHYLETILKT